MKRNDFLAHVGWTGAGLAFVLGADGIIAPAAAASTHVDFIQISDSHIGFHGPAASDVAATLAQTVQRINALPVQPSFVIHTGDVTHLAKPEQFDAAHGILATLRAPLITIPGEHDVLGGDANYRATFGTNDAPLGWKSWDQNGTHYIALVNVFDAETMGKLGTEQLDWLAKDLAGKPASTAIVVFGHVPLYAMYEPWGWTTEDGAKALALLRRFDAVTILNGHVHQVASHTDGNLRFWTAASTAYPQPAPGTAERPGPLKVDPDRLLHVLGYRTVELTRGGVHVEDVDLA